MREEDEERAWRTNAGMSEESGRIEREEQGEIIRTLLAFRGWGWERLRSGNKGRSRGV